MWKLKVGVMSFILMIWRKVKLISGLLWWLSAKESAFNAGDLGSIPGSGRSPEGGNGSPRQYSCLENLMDWWAWRATVCRVAKSRTRLKRLSMHTHVGDLTVSAELHSHLEPKLGRNYFQARLGCGQNSFSCDVWLRTLASYWLPLELAFGCQKPPAVPCHLQFKQW